MPVVLTADICAHGVIAAARYLGYAPERAMLAQRGASRAAVTAAALAAEQLTQARRDTIARIFGLLPTSLARAVRENTKATEKATALAASAMTEAGLDLSGGGLVWEKPVDRRVKKVRLPGPAKVVLAAPAGTAIAPPVGLKSPVAPAPAEPAAPARVDHTDMLRAALRRREGPVQYQVVGVETDHALIPEAEAHACRWPLGDLMLGTHRSCGAEVVAGRMYCAAHCKAAGLKPTPKAIEVVGRVAAPYRDPRADNAAGRKAAS